MRALALSALLACGAAAAQTGEPEAATASEPSAAARTTARAQAEPEPAPTRADRERAVEDYEASEQISEDSAVSFPVDI